MLDSAAMAVEVVLVPPEECLPVRCEVLRPGLPEEQSVYAEDSDERSTHYAVKKGKQTLGVISLLHDQRGGVGSEMWRIRGLAVREEHRKQGHGGKLIEMAKAIAGRRGGGVWANVRTTAQDFYAAHGFVPEGEVFDLPGIGPHVVMTWRP